MNFQLPPEISFHKEQLPECQAYIFRHNTLGEIGRIVVQILPNGYTHLSSEVVGEPNDPMTKTRQAIFAPLSEQITTAMEVLSGKGELGDPIPPVSPKAAIEVIESKRIPCERCGVDVAMLVFTDDEATTPGHFEDYARKMYHQYSDLDVSTWIIGPPVGELNGPNTPTNIMKVWPDREPIKTVTADEFNAELDILLNEHCGYLITAH